MIKLLSVSTMVLLLSGCFYQTIDGVEIDKAISLCNSVDSKVWEISEHALSMTKVVCSNDKSFDLDAWKLGK